MQQSTHLYENHVEIAGEEEDRGGEGVHEEVLDSARRWDDAAGRPNCGDDAYSTSIPRK